VGQKWRTSGYHLWNVSASGYSWGCGAYLIHDVFQRVWTVDCKTNKDDVRLGVGKRAQAVVLLLASGIPKGELDHLACRGMRCVGDVVLKDSGHVFLGGSAMSWGGRRERHTSGKLPEL
jgi:hypothetical protein